MNPDSESPVHGGSQLLLPKREVAALREVLVEVTRGLQDHPPFSRHAMQSLAGMAPTTVETARERPPEADVFVRSSICDNCGQWIGWGTHRATGYTMPIDIPLRPDGTLLLFSNGWNVLQRGVIRGEHHSITERRCNPHKCGRRSTPTKIGRQGYVDPTRELRRQTALRRGACSG